MILNLIQIPVGKNQLLELAEGARAAVREAERQILQICEAAGEGTPQHRNKTDGSPLTAADMASHQILAQRLAALSPRYPVISEEGEGGKVAPQPEGSPYWLIDPLDGTKEFLAGNGEFTVNVALISGGAAVWGAVAAPAKGLLYEGGAGLGSRLWRGMTPTVIHVAAASQRQCRVPTSRSHPDPHSEAALAGLGRHFATVIPMPLGSALKFCAIAEGKADCYPRFGQLRQWDLAAGQAVVEGAGGGMLRLEDGLPVVYGEDASRPVSPFVAFGDDTPDWRKLIGP